MAPRRNRRDRPSGFSEHVITEEAFAKLKHHKREIIQRYGIPLESEPGQRRFKMTRQWADFLFPAKD